MKMKHVLVMFGSTSDALVYNRIVECLRKERINVELRILSAHRTPEEVDKVIAAGKHDVIIAGAGLAAHLPGVIAARTTVPIIGVPCNSNFDGIDSLLSIVQMPPGIPVISVGVDRAEEAARGAQLMMKKYNDVCITGDETQKAVQSCVSMLKELGTTYRIGDVDDGSVNILFSVLGEAQSHTALVLTVPIAQSQRAADAQKMMAMMQNGLFLGVNRGENAALAAAAILGQTERIKKYRAQMKQKVLDADSEVHDGL